MGKFSGAAKIAIKESIVYKFEMALSAFFAPITLIVNYLI